MMLRYRIPSQCVSESSFEKGLDFWADAAVALGDSLPHQTRVVPQGDMGYGVKATVTIEQGSKVAAYLLTGLSYIDPTCDTPLVYSFNLPLVKACGPAVASWMHAAHQCPWKIHNTRVGMNSGELHDFIGMALTNATSGHSKDIDQRARRYLDTHGMAVCFFNQSKDPNAIISWTSVTAVV